MKTQTQNIGRNFFSAIIVWMTIQGAQVMTIGQGDDKSRAGDLSGIVRDKSGSAVHDAHIFVYTAGPRVGTSPI